jgi:hypothetical protein
VLTAAIGVIVATALAAIVNGVVIATGGSALVKEILEGSGVPAGLSDADLELAVQLAGYASLDEFMSTFEMRGYLSLGAGVALLLSGALMRGAATWARVLVTVSAVLVTAFSVVIVADETTPLMAGLALLAVLGSVAAIVLTWLPANGRYAKATA